MTEFRTFQKIARLSRDMVITEKLDGTNAQILVSTDPHPTLSIGIKQGDYYLYAGSRNRWLSPGGDNFGFFNWVLSNSAELVKLGEGRHYGEWWGQGIQRGYGLKEKRFSLFNVGKWRDTNTPVAVGDERMLCPACCHTVPKIYEGPFNTDQCERVLWRLAKNSVAAPGYDNPEGIVIYHSATGYLFKKTFEGDEKGKGQ